jgi:serine/threonine protein kinase/dipeptidyl aminopeptidase/acylaminoacyl peptidase
VGSENQPLPELDELAEAVLEGGSVDWASAELSSDALDRGVVRQLKVLAGIAGLHRSLTSDMPVPAPARAPAGRLEQWGRLKLLERIGRGSFGEVYRAWDSKLDREVAVKLLHAGGERPEGATVLEEARLLARVRHPNVVTVYDADEIEGRVGLWMEFIHGRNLEESLRERKVFDDREVTRIGIEVCRALSAVHDAGLLHRDVKAQNLMQAGDGRLVLMDFGTGRELEETSGSSADAAGTPLYLAPEIFKGERATVRSDIYSAGVLLFHLLTGAYPVRGATVREIAEAHASGKRLELGAGGSGTARGLAAAIGRAIQPDPSARFESTREMLAALENVQRKSVKRKRERSWLAVGAVLVIVISVAVISGMRRSNQGRDPKSQAGRSPYYGLSPEKRAVQLPPVMLTGTPSPDGRYLPYSEAATGNLALYEFATGNSRTLTNSGDGGSNYATESVVSADSSQIAYTWNDSSCDCAQVHVIDTGGVNDRILYGGRGIPDAAPLEWSHDGSQILATRQKSTGETDAVLISVLDGSVSLVRTFEHGPFMITLSPDGRYVAYDRSDDPGDTDHGIFVSARDGSGEVRVVTGPSYDSHPMWTPDGSGLVFASMRTGGPGLWLQRIQDGKAEGQPQLLDKDMGPFGPITLTRRGSLFYRHRTGIMDVYSVPINPATGDVKGEPTVAATRFLGSNISPDWSPDGRTLVFASWRTLFGPGRNILVFHSMDTGHDRDLEVDMALVNGPHFVPNGRFIAVGGPDRMGVRALRLIDPETGRIVSTFLAKAGDIPLVGGVAWCSDGKHAYLKRNDSRRISRIDITTGAEEPVYDPPANSVLGGLSLSPDGRWLAFVLNMTALKTSRLTVIPAAGGRPRDLVEIPRPDRVSATAWMHDGKHILFVRTATAGAEGKQFGELWAVPVDGGPPRSLGLTMPALRDLRVSPDGGRVAFTAGFPDTGFWVFENFLAETSRRSP